MNAITSYLRHLIVAGVLLAVAKYQLPLDGAEEMANALALLGIGTVTWLLVKYAPDLAKFLGIMAVMLCALPGCADLAGLPIKATVQMEEGTLSYSSKGGLEMACRPGYGRMPAVYADK